MNSQFHICFIIKNRLDVYKRLFSIFANKSYCIKRFEVIQTVRVGLLKYHVARVCFDVTIFMLLKSQGATGLSLLAILYIKNKQ